MEITFEQLPSIIGTIAKQITNIEKILSEKSENVPQADQLLTIQQASEIICLTVPTIYGLVSRSEIPCMKKGKRLYFSKKELSDWIISGRKKTHRELEIEAKTFINQKAK